MNKDGKSPKDNISMRLKIRDDVSSKIDVDVEYIIDLFLSYQLDYFETIQIISTAQLLRICRKASTLKKPEHVAFVNYSILSISLEAPITCQEFNNAVASLQSLNSFPTYLERQIKDFLELIDEENELFLQTPENVEENIPDEIEVIQSSQNMSNIFNKDPLYSEQSANSIFLEESLGNGAEAEVLMGFLSKATKGYSDFSILLNYFSLRREIYPKFTAFILAITSKSVEELNKQNRLNDNNNISLFKRTFVFSRARSYFSELLRIVAEPFFEYVTPIELPSNFDKDLCSILDICSEFTNNYIFFILAAMQYRDDESIARYTQALAYSYIYSQTKDIDPPLAACGIELMRHKKGYAAALFQFVDADSEIFKELTDKGISGDELLEAMPFFFDINTLRMFMEKVKDSQSFILAFSAKNIEEMDTVGRFRDLCIMRLLNSLSKDFSVSNLNIFNAITK
ncbi:hypothetical protein TRFO_09331 [Tritrichomonas foetus]|uniref:Uncharacterized protein n=1 Tax=Tritrichomonas foetus TaxID=1144522 RepID=A0A1J4JJ85_9EUKA|nr:hypothetical protein TRFO_09331 [Tritrichomonas foetus]|eukprot:OHS97629.1 hypothetical protein TRFO_09331 [Tritrichomonas foetus]